MPWTSGCVSCWRWRRARSRWRRCAAGSGSAGGTATSGSSRYRAEGVAGLADRSRAPLHHPQAVAAALAEACLAVRRAHPTWGPLKVRAWLERQQPAGALAGGEHDRRAVRPRRADGASAAGGAAGRPASAPFAACAAANDVWCIDFKGWFRTGDGAPLRAADARATPAAATCCAARRSARTDTAHVWPILDAALREYGLPLAASLRSDNGPPFASTGAGGLSRLAVLVIKAGVRPERIRPGKPQQNGRHERLHLTLLQDTARPPAASLRPQQKRFAGVPGGPTTRSGRTRRSATPRRPSATRRRRGAGTGCCARPRPSPTRSAR